MKCSTYLAFRETQIKSTLRFPLVPIRMAKINSKRKTNDNES